MQDFIRFIDRSLNRIKGSLRRAKWPFILVVTATGLGGLIAIWSSRDLTLIDKMGHIDSAISLFRYGLHGFNDQHFLGYIQNLFYPPLEDFLLLLFIKSLPFLTLGSRYLVFQSAIWLAWVGIVTLMISRLQGLKALIGLFAFAWFVFRDRSESLAFQGLSIIEFTRTGLTSQMLSFIGVLCLTHLLLSGSRRLGAYVFWIVWVILSHIVVGLAATLLLTCIVLISPDSLPARPSQRSLWFTGLAIAGLTTFYWLPFLAHSEFIASSKILAKIPAVLWLGVLTAFVLSQDRLARSYLLTGWLLLTHDGLLHSVLNLSEGLPRFHYYRLDAVGFALALLGIMVEAARASSMRRPALGRIGLVVILISMLAGFRISVPPQSPSTDEELAEAAEIMSLRPQGAPRRTWVIEPR